MPQFETPRRRSQGNADQPRVCGDVDLGDVVSSRLSKAGKLDGSSGGLNEDGGARTELWCTLMSEAQEEKAEQPVRWEETGTERRNWLEAGVLTGPSAAGQPRKVKREWR